MATKKAAAPNIDIVKEVQAASKALAPAAKRLAAALAKVDPAKLPVGAAADLLYDLHAVAKLVPGLNAPFDDAIAPVLKTLEEHFIETLAVGESSGVQGLHSRVQVTESVIPAVENWEKFYAHIKKTGSFELLNRAVNRAAVAERWDAKKQVPGVTAFHAKKVSCTKLGGKK